MSFHFSALLCDILNIDSKIKHNFDDIINIIISRAIKKENDYMYFEDTITQTINVGISCRKTKFKRKHLRTFAYHQIIECDKYVQTEAYKPNIVESLTITL